MATLAPDAVARREDRLEAVANRFGLTHCDHTAVSARDPEMSAQFFIQLLGCSIEEMHGYSAEDQAMGRVKHLFLWLGDSKLQLGVPHDRRSYADPADSRPFPRWALRGSAEVLQATLRRLELSGVPVSGPWSHGDSEATSIFFQDPEGNKFELLTWEPYPAGGVRRLGVDGLPDWPQLAHTWRSASGPVFGRNIQGRFGGPPAVNTHGIEGLDHVTLGARLLQDTASFYLDVLGAVPFRSGQGRREVLSLHMGRTLVNLLRPAEGEAGPDPGYGGWNHWSFGASRQVLDVMLDRLRRHRIPFTGPWAHGGTDAVSFYFVDPEGNHLEVCTGDGYPVELTKLAGRDGRIESPPYDWQALRTA